jgi:hypothetical protein
MLPVVRADSTIMRTTFGDITRVAFDQVLLPWFSISEGLLVLLTVAPNKRTEEAVLRTALLKIDSSPSLCDSCVQYA